MAQLGNPALHFYMTRGMARLLGINLGDALRDGRLAAQDYADMVTRCRACPLSDQCQSFLARTTDMTSPPEHCANADDFTRLRLH